MDFWLVILLTLPGVISLAVSCVYAYIAFKKSKEPPKDEIWETTLRLLSIEPNALNIADDFVKTYEELKFFKEHPEFCQDKLCLEQALREFRSAHTADQNESGNQTL